MTIAIVIADAQPLLLDGLQQMLEGTGEFRVLARCTTGTAVLQEVEQRAPDLVLMDTRLPELDGLAVLAAIRRRIPSPRVVLFTATISEAELVEGVRLGVDGVVLKDMPPRLLLQCLHKVHRGGRWVESRAMQDALESAVRRQHATRSRAGQLTPRERETVRMVAHGLRNKAIARRLAISEATVKVHVRNVYKKLGLSSRIDVRCYAEEHKLL